MDLPTTGVGSAALLFGLVSAAFRVIKPSVFHKLGPMREKFGETGGNIIHFTLYVIVPIAVGCALIAAGVFGVSIF